MGFFQPSSCLHSSIPIFMIIITIYKIHIRIAHGSIHIGRRYICECLIWLWSTHIKKKKIVVHHHCGYNHLVIFFRCLADHSYIIMNLSLFPLSLFQCFPFIRSHYFLKDSNIMFVCVCVWYHTIFKID